MLVYAAVLIACLVLLAAAHLGSEHRRKQITLFCVFCLACFSALRGHVGTDTYAYHSMFSTFSNDSLGDILGIVEPLFALLMKSVALFSDNSFVFVVLISIIQGLLLARVAATSKNPLDFLAIYVTIFYLNFHFNIVRAGTAILLLILAMRVPKESGNQTTFYAFGVAATMAHYSAIIGFVPMLLIRQRAANAKMIFIALVVLTSGAAFLLATADEHLLSKYLTYADLLGSDTANSISLSFILGIPLYLLLYISAVNRRNLAGLTLMFVVWLSARWLTTVFSLFGRVEVVINALLLFSIIELALVGWRQRLRKVAVTGLTVMWLFGSLLTLQEESSIMDRLGVSDSSYLLSPYVPYKFIWDVE
jgi:hypothetical protein